ncbi:MAG: hypothetical protein BroJett020_11790 [Bacteroidota bacterium]|nr:MAG: hypothetical protein BroJett020_11790 [Bacteroidota bacterium]
MKSLNEVGYKIKKYLTKKYDECPSEMLVVYFALNKPCCYLFAFIDRFLFHKNRFPINVGFILLLYGSLKLFLHIFAHRKRYII